MKMVVAYIPPESFEGIRSALLDLGFPSLSALSAAGTSPEATVTTTYRGTTTEQHTRAKSRVECVIGDEHVDTVVSTIIDKGGEHTFAFVVPVEGAYPLDTVKLDSAEAAV